MLNFNVQSSNDIIIFIRRMSSPSNSFPQEYCASKLGSKVILSSSASRIGSLVAPSNLAFPQSYSH